MPGRQPLSRLRPLAEARRKVGLQERQAHYSRQKNAPVADGGFFVYNENMPKDAPKMRGYRMRDKMSGRLRKKRSDTKVRTLQKRYKRKLAKKSNLQLGTLLKRRHKKSLKKLLK